MRHCMQIICNNSDLYIEGIKKLPLELREKIEQCIKVLSDCDVLGK